MLTCISKRNSHVRDLRSVPLVVGYVDLQELRFVEQVRLAAPPEVRECAVCAGPSVAMLDGRGAMLVASADMQQGEPVDCSAWLLRTPSCGQRTH